MLVVIRKSDGAVLYRVSMGCWRALDGAEQFIKRMGLRRLYKSILGPRSAAIWVA